MTSKTSTNVQDNKVEERLNLTFSTSEQLSLLNQLRQFAAEYCHTSVADCARDAISRYISDPQNKERLKFAQKQAKEREEFEKGLNASASK